FQAEDSIRDRIVTGVQTCALPIFDAADASAGTPCGGEREGQYDEQNRDPSELLERDVVLEDHFSLPFCVVRVWPSPGPRDAGGRSEERRVGKVCRCQWSVYC